MVKLELDVLKHIIRRSAVDEIENYVLSFMSQGWDPSVPLPVVNGHIVDHITHDWPFVPLIEALLPLVIYILIIFFGIIFIKKERRLLPQAMTYYIKFFYNFLQIFLCSYMTIESYLLSVRNNYNPLLIPIFGRNECNIFDSVNPKIANLLYIFYISKILDFVDTILIIINGKTNQFTFLHIYHHCTIYSIYWINISIAYDSDIYFTILLNGLIHGIMYCYYLISMHINNKKIIWWKKYLTTLQLIQFIGMITQGSLILFHQCTEVPPRVPMLYVAYISSLFVMFLKFYFKSYSKRSNKQKNL